jgi:D-alanyl-D-alanine carboxypeptidase (penicillin-binding protein 5/6)
VITVVMKSADWAADTKTLLDWGFGSNEWITYFKPGEIIGTPKVVSGGETDELPVGTTKIAKSLIPKGASRETEYSFDIKPNLKAPIKKGEMVGNLLFEDAQGFKQKLSLVAMADIAAKPLALPGASRRDVSLLAVGGLLLGGAYMMRRKARMPVGRLAPVRKPGSD